VSETRYKQGGSPVTPGGSPLSPRQAFAVQFRVGAETVRGRFAGRVEPVVSGHAAYFRSRAELGAFFTRALAGVEASRSRQ